ILIFFISFEINRFSRRKLLLVSFLLAATGVIGALLLSDKAEYDKGYLAGKIFMSMFVANFSSGIAFSLVYIYAAELFPTTLRNVAMGTSTAWARVSGFASAYAPLLVSVFLFLFHFKHTVFKSVVSVYPMFQFHAAKKLKLSSCIHVCILISLARQEHQDLD
ncbi:solute carrier family 22 member 16-like, partial [Orbicella faveolata]|uniref:solute carrier family 22 member 16-like n=1 Tax=Orbicella faveolata TaxID=48498 RepID=UPI0009E2B8E4